MDKFFANNIYVVNEKVQALKFTNGYKVQNEQGEDIGFIKENMPGSRILLSMIFSKKNLPMTLEVHNNEGKTIASLTRGWTLVNSKVKVLDENQQQVATLQQIFGIKPKFDIFDSNNNKIGIIKGDWVAWDFKILDANEQQIGTISKQYNGFAKEFFTDADKYVVTIDPSVTNEAMRIAIGSTAAAIDMILKEND